VLLVDRVNSQEGGGIVNLSRGLSRTCLMCHTRRMNTPATNRYKNHRFPAEIISHGVWLYYRFCLSYRDVEELLFVRGIVVTYESIRKWCRKFGQQYANQLRRQRPRPGDTWRLDGMFLTINGERRYLWRAVDQDGTGLDILVQRQRDKQAAKTFFRKLLKGLTYVPRVIITDKLKSYGAAKREILPSVEHRQHRYLNNRAENSHHPPAGTAHAGLQVGRARAAVPLRLWSDCATLPTPAPPLACSRLPPTNAATISHLTGNHEHSNRRIRLTVEGFMHPHARS
jgi:putative transposase